MCGITWKNINQISFIDLFLFRLCHFNFKRKQFLSRLSTSAGTYVKPEVSAFTVSRDAGLGPVWNGELPIIEFEECSDVEYGLLMKLLGKLGLLGPKGLAVTWVERLLRPDEVTEPVNHGNTCNKIKWWLKKICNHTHLQSVSLLSRICLESAQSSGKGLLACTQYLVMRK